MRFALALVLGVASTVACTETPTDTTIYSDLDWSMMRERVATETSCDNLGRDAERDSESLAEQEADPDYGMTPEQVAFTQERLDLTKTRMDELGC